MMRFRSIALAFVVTLLVGCEQAEPLAHRFTSVDITNAPWGKDFALTDHNGVPRTLADFKGKAVILFFGYVNCPDMCPMTLYKLSIVMQQLGPDAERVQVLFVTLDPARDTPEVLGQYAPGFHPSFLGMYADEETIARTAKDFKVFSAKQEADAEGFYTVDHMGPSFVFDAQGRLRLFVSDEHSADAVAEDLRTLLKSER